MVQPCPARIRMRLEDVETPALIVDLTAYESKIASALRKLGLDPYLDQPPNE